MPIVGELVNGDDGRSVRPGDRGGVGDVVHVAVGKENVVDLFGQHVVLGVLGIVRDERIDEQVCAFGGPDQHRGVAEPGDAGSFERGHSFS